MQQRRRASCLLLALRCLLPEMTQAQSPSASNVDSGYAALIVEEWRRYPLMELRDLYKFVHQSAMGPGHAVHDTVEVRKWMEREIAGLTAPQDLDEPAVSPLRPDSGLVRVNLRPYLEAGGDSEALLRSFIRSANEYEPSTERLRHYWSIVIDLAQSGEIRVDVDSALALIGKMEELGFPALHHSRAYFEAYQPAYRVIQKRLIPP